MGVAELLVFFGRLLSRFFVGFLDIVLAAVFVAFAFEEISGGIVSALFNFLWVLCIFFAGVLIYPFLSPFITNFTSIPKESADGASLLIVVLIFGIILRIWLYFVKKNTDFSLPASAEYIATSILLSISFFFIASYILLLLVTLPFSLQVKQSIYASIIGKFMLGSVYGMEKNFLQWSGRSTDSALNFLTVSPDSNATVPLYFKSAPGVANEDSKERLVELIAQARKRVKLSEYTVDSMLNSIAQNYAEDMLKNGFLSHYSLSGMSFYDRLEAGNIIYTQASELIAQAPTEERALSGLLASVKSKQIILSSQFKRIGVGVADGKNHGKIFVILLLL